MQAESSRPLFAFNGTGWTHGTPGQAPVLHRFTGFLVLLTIPKRRLDPGRLTVWYDAQKCSAGHRRQSRLGATLLERMVTWPYTSPAGRVRITLSDKMVLRLTFAVVLLVCLACACRAEPTLLDAGYRQLYNLQFAEAHRSFAEWQRVNPTDPLGPISEAAAYLFTEFDRLRILESEFFLDDGNFTTREKLSPDPVIKKKFLNALAAGQLLADRALAVKANDQNALFAAILRTGLLADYLALIEKRNFAALGEVKTGRALAQKLLAINPDYCDAYLAIGVENYLLSLKPAPVRWLLRISGAQTDKEHGINSLHLVAQKGRYLLPYARVLLAVAALRDNDRNGARRMLQGLAKEFPENRLYSRELARLQ